MAFILNVIWFILGGGIMALGWLIWAAVFYITIIGAPIGRACLEFAQLSAAPFGKTIITEAQLKGAENVSGFKKVITVILNIIWLPIGLISTLLYLILGILSMITLVGIPVGVVYIRMGKFIFKPIGVRVVRKDLAKMARRVNG